MSELSSQQVACLKSIGIIPYQARQASQQHPDFIYPLTFQTPCLVLFEVECQNQAPLKKMLEGMLSVLELSSPELAQWPLRPSFDVSKVIERLKSLQAHHLLILGAPLSQSLVPALKSHSSKIFQTHSPIELTQNPALKRAAFDCLKALKKEVSHFRR